MKNQDAIWEKIEAVLTNELGANDNGRDDEAWSNFLEEHVVYENYFQTYANVNKLAEKLTPISTPGSSWEKIPELDKLKEEDNVAKIGSIQQLMTVAAYSEAVEFYYDHQPDERLSRIKLYWLKFPLTDTKKIEFLAKVAASIMCDTLLPERPAELNEYTGNQEIELTHFSELLDRMFYVDMEKMTRWVAEQFINGCLRWFGIQHLRPIVCPLFLSLFG